jgi:hypothetical protein
MECISRGERICRETMEMIYGVHFISVRPDWLINPETGCKLELDCYNEELRIAVEYNGEQHYKWPNFTNQTREEFINQVRRDLLKIDLCQIHNVYLISVPYNIVHDDIFTFIFQRIPENFAKNR